MAEPTGFEPAISGLTGQYAKPLHTAPRTSIQQNQVSRQPRACVNPVYMRFTSKETAAYVRTFDI